MTEYKLTSQEADRLSRLPKWVNDLVSQKIRTLNDQAKQIAKLSEGDPRSNTWVENYGGMPGTTAPDVPLGVNTQVRFDFPHEGDVAKFAHAIHAGFVSRNGDSCLEIQGGDSLIVHPYSSNLIRVSLDH